MRDQQLRAKLPVDAQLSELWAIADLHSRRLEVLETRAAREDEPITVRPQWRSLPPILRSLPPAMRRHRGPLISGGTAALLLLVAQELIRWLATGPNW